MEDSKFINFNIKELENYIYNDIGLEKLADYDSYQCRLRMAYISDSRINLFSNIAKNHNINKEDSSSKSYEDFQKLYGDDANRKILYDDTRKIILRAIFKDLIKNNFPDYSNHTYDLYFNNHQLNAPLYQISNYFQTNIDAEQFYYDVEIMKHDILYLLPGNKRSTYNAPVIAFTDWLSIITIDNKDIMFINNELQQCIYRNNIPIDNIDNLCVEYNYYVGNNIVGNDKLIKMIRVDSNNQVYFYNEKGVIVDGN